MDTIPADTAVDPIEPAPGTFTLADHLDDRTKADLLDLAQTRHDDPNDVEQVRVLNP